MPNLNLTYSLKKKYGESDNLTKGFDIEILNESFRYDKSRGIQGFDIDQYSNFDGEKLNDIVSVFENREKKNVVLCFVDMSEFSTHFKSNDNSILTGLLDLYYETVIPIIYEYGGEVEKLIGDGIVFMFGEPFLNEKKWMLFGKAFACSKKILNATYRIGLTSKIAIHSGEVVYYQPNTDDFNEYTMIGNSLTELFRLESISVKNAINYYVDSELDTSFILAGTYKNLRQLTPETVNTAKWIFQTPFPVSLNGVDYDQVRYVQLNTLYNDHN